MGFVRIEFHDLEGVLANARMRVPGLVDSAECWGCLHDHNSSQMG